jgi:HNH endonuclease
MDASVTSITPPVTITGIPLIDWIVFLAGYIALLRLCLYWMLYIHRAREGVWQGVENIATGLIVFCFFMAVLISAHLEPSSAAPISMIIGLLATAIFSERRSRYVPVAVRRVVIARDLKGKPFDSSKHHIDHIVPFSRGGSHTIDNLRVTTKGDNLKKGRKRPRLRDF